MRPSPAFEVPLLRLHEHQHQTRFGLDKCAGWATHWGTGGGGQLLDPGGVPPKKTGKKVKSSLVANLQATFGRRNPKPSKMPILAILNTSATIYMSLLLLFWSRGLCQAGRKFVFATSGGGGVCSPAGSYWQLETSVQFPYTRRTALIQ